MSSADMMETGGDSSVILYGRLVSEWPARGPRSGMIYTDFAFVQAVWATTIKSDKKRVL
jgi:hypothetical protein